MFHGGVVNIMLFCFYVRASLWIISLEWAIKFYDAIKYFWKESRAFNLLIFQQFRGEKIARTFFT